MATLFDTITSTTVAVCAVVLTGLLVLRETRTRLASPLDGQVEDWESLGTAGHALTHGDGAIQLVVFSDFECPYCRALTTTLDSLSHEFPADLTIIFRHMPLVSLHPRAELLAIASECAAREDRWGVFHDAVFAAGDDLDSMPIVEIAERAGVVNPTEFTACRSDSAAMAVVRQDLEVGRRLGIRETPTMFLRDKRIVGAVGFDSLAVLVRNTLTH
jgi:protein-disulfide isomerase